VLRTPDAADAVAVAVVGSANLDLVVYAARSPEPGETVMGDDLEEHPGGKGLNQALAAALHAPTAFVGAVGSDHAADVLLAALTGAGVETSFVRRTAGKSGVAVVNLAADGENSITVIAGSNGDVTADETTRALDALQPRIVVTQLETPVSAVVAAAQWAAAEGARWSSTPALSSNSQRPRRTTLFVSSSLRQTRSSSTQARGRAFSACSGRPRTTCPRW